MTGVQLQALKTFIANDVTLNAFPNTPDGNFAIAQALNLLASPAFTVWRTNMTANEMLGAVVWTELIGRSVGERDAFRFMLAQNLINAAQPNIRSGITDIFSGAGGATTRTQLTALAKRPATVGEKVLATGTGTDASPATMGYEGMIQYQDVDAARTLP